MRLTGGHKLMGHIGVIYIWLEPVGCVSDSMRPLFYKQVNPSRLVYPYESKIKIWL